MPSVKRPWVRFAIRGPLPLVAGFAETDGLKSPRRYDPHRLPMRAQGYIVLESAQFTYEPRQDPQTTDHNRPRTTDHVTKTEPKKRNLTFANSNDMLTEARGLLENGYVSHGNWTLGQACSHIADWMRFPLDGFPKPPLPIRAMMWVMKHTVGPGMKRKILAEGFKGGMPTAPETVPAPGDMTDQRGVEKLQETITRVESYDGALHASPLFGPMDKETLIKVSLLHAEHHLGYLAPK